MASLPAIQPAPAPANPIILPPIARSLQMNTGEYKSPFNPLPQKVLHPPMESNPPPRADFHNHRHPSPSHHAVPPMEPRTISPTNVPSSQTINDSINLPAPSNLDANPSVPPPVAGNNQYTPGAIKAPHVTPPVVKPRPRPHVCLTCQRTFARREHLNRHELSHTKEKPFDCTLCGRGFARRDLLLRHKQKLHATNPYVRPRDRMKMGVASASGGEGTDGDERDGERMATGLERVERGDGIMSDGQMRRPGMLAPIQGAPLPRMSHDRASHDIPMSDWNASSIPKQPRHFENHEPGPVRTSGFEPPRSLLDQLSLAAHPPQHPYDNRRVPIEPQSGNVPTREEEVNIWRSPGGTHRVVQFSRELPQPKMAPVAPMAPMAPMGRPQDRGEDGGASGIGADQYYPEGKYRGRPRQSQSPSSVRRPEPLTTDGNDRMPGIGNPQADQEQMNSDLDGSHQVGATKGQPRPSSSSPTRRRKPSQTLSKEDEVAAMLQGGSRRSLRKAISESAANDPEPESSAAPKKSKKGKEKAAEKEKPRGKKVHKIRASSRSGAEVKKEKEKEIKSEQDGRTFRSSRLQAKYAGGT